MRLERLAVDLRPRNAWEAIDLGAAMLREWWPSLLRTWLVCHLPFVLLLSLVFLSYPWTAILLLWWTKPVFDRFVLHVASRAVFGEASTLRATLAAWREILSPGLLRALTIARFSGARSFHLPVFQLERQQGAAAIARMRVLDRKAAGAAYWLTVVCVHFETVLVLSLATLVMVMMPAESGGADRSLLELLANPGDSTLSIVDFGLYAFAVAVIEPLYVTAGLALYLHRRTQLEAWDVELAFRRMQSRIDPRSSRLAAILLALCAGLGVVTWPGDAHATTGREAVRAAVDEVLAAPEFQEYRKEKRWLPRNRASQNSPPPEETSPTHPFLERLAEVLRGAVWLLAIGVLALLLWLARRQHRPARAERRLAGRLPDVVLGMDIRPAALPTDPAAAARKRLEDGRVRDALALLYRASLAALVHGHGVQLHEGTTEGDALRAGTDVLGESAAAYWQSLLAAWQAVAYAARLPEREATARLVDAWPRHFAMPAMEGDR